MESAGAAAKSGLTVTIVERALVRIAQHVVRLGNRLELLLGFLRAVIAVGMAFHRQLAIRLLYCFVARAALDAERLIKISHGSWNSPSADPSPARTYVSRAR